MRASRLHHLLCWYLIMARSGIRSEATRQLGNARGWTSRHSAGFYIVRIVTETCFPSTPITAVVAVVGGILAATR